MTLTFIFLNKVRNMSHFNLYSSAIKKIIINIYTNMTDLYVSYPLEPEGAECMGSLCRIFANL